MNISFSLELLNLEHLEISSENTQENNIRIKVNNAVDDVNNAFYKRDKFTSINTLHKLLLDMTTDKENLYFNSEDIKQLFIKCIKRKKLEMINHFNEYEKYKTEIETKSEQLSKSGISEKEIKDNLYGTQRFIDKHKYIQDDWETNYPIVNSQLKKLTGDEEIYFNEFK
jgi:hypothetical protein